MPLAIRGDSSLDCPPQKVWAEGRVESGLRYDETTHPATGRVMTLGVRGSGVRDQVSGKRNREQGTANGERGNGKSEGGCHSERSEEIQMLGSRDDSGFHRSA